MTPSHGPKGLTKRCADLTKDPNNLEFGTSRRAWVNLVANAEETRVRVTMFFFSSRRRHTRCSRDWSSDVCSSDLLDEDPRWGTRLDNLHVTHQLKRYGIGRRLLVEAARELVRRRPADRQFYLWVLARSGERRVGEEGRIRGAPGPLKKKKKQ